jgi:putative peptidoglycan lipid II flippase
VLYGLSVVLFGLLQAYRRFAGYALAPLVASLVLITSYLAFAPLGKGLPLGQLPMSAQLILSGGATLGIAGMVVVGTVPTLRLGLRLRPTLAFPPGIARRAGGLVVVGLAEMVVQELSGIAVIALANGRGATGALVILGYATQVFYSLNAVLALSIVLSAFPVLSARDGSVFDRTCAGSTRAVILMSCLGVAVTGAITVPAAHVLAKDPSQVPQLMLAFALLAPGLVSVGVLANLARAMLALGKLKVAGFALAGGGLLQLTAQVVLSLIVPARLVVGALALGNTIGATAAAIPLVIITRRIRGAEAVRGVGRATLAGLAAGVVGAVIGVGVSVAIPVHHRLLYGIVGAVAAVFAVGAFGVVAYFLDDGDSRVVAARLRQTLGVLPAQWPALVTWSVNRAYDQIWRGRGRGTRTVWNVNSGAQDDRLESSGDSSAPHLLTPREQQWAIGIGIISGAAGGYAVFTTSNQAGTFMLLLIALVFLLLGLAGTPLLRQLRRPAKLEQARHGRRSSEPSGQATRLIEEIPGSEPSLVPATEADVIPYQSEWPGGDDGRS